MKLGLVEKLKQLDSQTKLRFYQKSKYRSVDPIKNFYEEFFILLPNHFSKDDALKYINEIEQELDEIVDYYEKEYLTLNSASSIRDIQKDILKRQSTISYIMDRIREKAISGESSLVIYNYEFDKDMMDITISTLKDLGYIIVPDNEGGYCIKW